MSDVEVRADDFFRLSKALKGNPLRKELHKGAQKAAKPLIAEARAGWARDLPQGGGVASRMSRKRARIAVATGANPGVRVVFAKVDPRLESEGRLVHPVFGRRPNVVQRVKSGIGAAALRTSIPPIRNEIEAAMVATVQKIIEQARS